ncbi:hypothetical protein QE152_g6259 [Popillia japonica]|uniref:Uncharacterized protein n=1 Tax=Popillia japonica TaxID=7064 RepID=A0AAW1MKJ7_POPJA
MYAFKNQGRISTQETVHRITDKLCIFTRGCVSSSLIYLYIHHLYEAVFREKRARLGWGGESRPEFHETAPEPVAAILINVRREFHETAPEPVAAILINVRRLRHNVTMNHITLFNPENKTTEMSVQTVGLYRDDWAMMVGRSKCTSL